MNRMLRKETRYDQPRLRSCHREFVRQVLRDEVDLRADGNRFVNKGQEPERSLNYRRQMNAEGSPTDTVAAGWRWSPGGELVADKGLKQAA